MFGIIYGDNCNKNTCVKGLLFNTHQAAYDYMETMNQILDHYTGQRLSYYIQPTEKSFEKRNCSHE